MEFTLQLKDAKSRVILEKNAHLHLKDYLDLNSKVMVISDDNIPSTLKKKVMDQIENGILVEVVQGEDAKSFPVYEMLLKKLLEHEFSRKDLVIALGGGVIGDLSGFVASTYKRGCRFASIPTTTLSQIDSSIGGKVAINMNGIKNCVGNFYHPEVVIIDTQTLHTLPKRHFYNGLVEALKAGCIQDEKLFDLFKKHAHELNVDSIYLEEIIERSLLMKKRIVEQDEKEQNLRKILNFGHTLGHALESLHLNEYYHGECVGNGMILIEEDEKIRKDLKDILKRMQIPMIHENDVEKMMECIRNDKKAKDDEIDIIQVRKIGSAEIVKIKTEDLKKILEGGLL